MKLRLICAFTLCCLALHASALTFTVTTTADEGAGSLREAILAANANPGPDDIRFNIFGAGVQTIRPLTALPTCTGTVNIDGYSQQGSSPNTLPAGNNALLRIRLDGSAATDPFPTGLRFTGAGHVVRGLVIVNFYQGIELNVCTNCIVAGNFIGLDVDGLVSPNRSTGVYLTAAGFNRCTGNLIGGTAPADRNVISGNNYGISLFPQTAEGNSIQGNFLGTDASGTLPRGNLFSGVSLQSATNNWIGGSEQGARNIIAANGTGISLLGTSRIVIQGNFIGTDVSGNYDLGNSGDGIALQGAHFTSIGGTEDGSGNVLANNRRAGISLLGCNSNVIRGNILGTDRSNTRPFGNREAGITLSGHGNLIGGILPEQANLIRLSGTAGVWVTGGEGNVLRGNRIYDNRGLGIDLGASGVTTNDPGDGDGGANALQNFPVLTNAVASDTAVQIRGYLSSGPSAAYTLDFYANHSLDPSGHGEAQQWIGTATVTTSGPDGVAEFSALLPATGLAGRFITATATDRTNNTSELSAAVLVTPAPLSVRLVIHRSGSTNLVTWDSAAFEGRLEYTDRLTPSIQWWPVTNAVFDNGVAKRVWIPIPSIATNQFYRLRPP